VELTLQEIADLVGGRLDPKADPNLLVRGVAALAEAGEGDLTFFGNARYLPALKQSRGSAVLVPTDFTESVAPALVRVENPSLAFSMVIARFAPEPIRYAPGIHPTAVVGAGVELGEGVSLQPYVVVEDGARIGSGTVVGSHGHIGKGAVVGSDCQFAPRVTVGHGCKVGNRVILHSGVVLGSDGFGFEFSGGRHVKIPQTGIVQVDDDVEIGANTTVDRARFGRTWIGAGTKIDNLVQIAHNVTIGKHCLLVSQAGISGSTQLGNYVTVAGQSGIVGHIQIGDAAVIAARSGVSKGVAAKEIVWGSPALPMREAKELNAWVRRLPKLGERLKRLEQAFFGKAGQPPSESDQ
jgi:UDP-3-O-[3-hydroxymyristoyl] glucosamine N-acyltransferase